MSTNTIQNVIRLRRSHRTYEARPIGDALRRDLAARLEAVPPGPFGRKVRMALVDRRDMSLTAPWRLGTYGVIRGARTFLVGAVSDGAGAMEDFGFGFEWAVLQATALGLGTCWLGGTFHRGSFGEAAQLQSGEVMPAVSPVGHSAVRTHVLDTVLRWGAGSDHRKPWTDLFFDGRFGKPLAASRAGRYRDALEMLRLAPSASNRQPWRIVYDEVGGGYHFFVERSRGYRAATPTDLQRVDLGIAMCHFQLTCEETGLVGSWEANQPSRISLPARTEYVGSWRPAR